MPTPLTPDQPYAGHQGMRCLNTWVDPETMHLLQVLSPTKKAFGHTISRLIHAEVARQEARREALADRAKAQQELYSLYGLKDVSGDVDELVVR